MGNLRKHHRNEEFANFAGLLAHVALEQICRSVGILSISLDLGDAPYTLDHNLIF